MATVTETFILKNSIKVGASLILQNNVRGITTSDPFVLKNNLTTRLTGPPFLLRSHIKSTVYLTATFKMVNRIQSVAGGINYGNFEFDEAWGM